MFSYMLYLHVFPHSQTVDVNNPKAKSGAMH